MTEHSVADIVVAPEHIAPGKRITTATLIAAILILLDQVTKSWAHRALKDDAPRHVFWTLQFSLYHNRGMAFSKGQGKGLFIGCAALLIVGVLFWSLRSPRSRLYVVCVGAVIGGALGNVADRLFRAEAGFLSGAVIDFIDFQWWPAFNVADMGVVVGAGLLIFDSWRHGRTTKVTS